MNVDEPSTPLESTAEYRWLQEFKRAHGREYRERFGAHSIGIGWKTVGGRPVAVPALKFYVTTKRRPEAAATAIPPYFDWCPPGESDPVRLHTDVVEAEPSSFE